MEFVQICTLQLKGHGIKQGGLWLGMTGGLSTQVKMNVKPIGAFNSGLIRQVAFERRGLKIQGPLYYQYCVIVGF